MTPPRMIALQTLRAVGEAFREYSQADWALRVVFFHYKVLDSELIDGLIQKPSRALTKAENRTLRGVRWHQDSLVENARRPDALHPVCGQALDGTEDSDRLLYFPKHELLSMSTMRCIISDRVNPRNEVFYWNTQIAYLMVPSDQSIRSERHATLATMSQMADKAMQGLFRDRPAPVLYRYLIDDILARTPLALHHWLPEGEGQWRCVDAIDLLAPQFGLWSETILNFAESAANAIELLVREAELAESIMQRHPELYCQSDLMPAKRKRKPKGQRPSDTGTDTTKNFQKNLRSQRTKDAIAYVNAYRDRVAAGVASHKTLDDLVREALEGESRDAIVTTIRNLRDDRPAAAYLRPDIRPAS